METEQKKISLPEIIIMLLIVSGAYLFGVVSDLSGPIPVVGQVLIGISELIDFISLAITQLWLIMKGGIMASRQLTVLAGNLAEFIPIVNLLPINIATLIIAIYLINNPKVEQVASLAKGKIKS